MAKSILIVEDHELIQRIFLYALAQLGCRVMTADNGEEGLEMARRDRPDVIIIDVPISDLSTVDTATILSEFTQAADAPIIAVTTSDGSPDSPRINDFGSGALIKKPLDMEAFVETVRAYLDLESWDGTPPIIH
jgi:two-component system cell cycle response regulator DivK